MATLTEVKCRHCHRSLLQGRSYIRRGLCFGCYHSTPAIRHQYPSPSKYGRRAEDPAHDEDAKRIVDVRKAARPYGHAALRIVRRADGYAVVKCWPPQEGHRTSLAYEEETDGLVYRTEAEAEKAAKEMMRERRC